MRTLWIVLVSVLLCWVPVQAASPLEGGPYIIQWGNPSAPHPLAALGEYAEVESHKPTRVLTKKEQDSIKIGVTYFSERFRSTVKNKKATVFVGFIDDSDGTAFSSDPRGYASEELKRQISPNGVIVDVLRDGKTNPLPKGTPDTLIGFNVPYDTTPLRQLLNANSVGSTMLHEMGHSMGIVTGFSAIGTDESTTGQFKKEKLTDWDRHLVDVFGKKVTPDMMIAMNAQDGNKKGVFQVFGNLSDPGTYKYPAFRGTHVDALTDNAGMPVMGAFGNDGNFLNEASSLGHSGIMLSMMSYGMIQNMNFTELELAMYQDLGYTIDRSEFFGKSYYLNVGGTNQVNNQGYGTEKAPKEASFGLGLQILRDNLTLTQTGSIYAKGYAAGGMRIDGVNNHLTLASGATVAVNGPQGTGVLVSYGRGNRVDLAGSVEATGAGGIGVQVGIMAVPVSYYSYGNWATTEVASQKMFEHAQILKDLNGPLVTRLDVRNKLAGKLAAIDIGPDAHVGTIALHAGATVLGNINSQWARNTAHENDEEHATKLVMGDKGNSGTTFLQGNIAWKANSKFTKGNTPTNSLDVQQIGGVLKFNGNANVASWVIEQGASLGGSSSITLHDGKGTFINSGSIAPGVASVGKNLIGRIVINGGYTQTASGNLVMAFNTKSSDTFVVKKKASIDGTLSLNPQPGFYDSATSRVLGNKELFEDTLQTALFPTVNIVGFNSPTLKGTVENTSNGALFRVERADNAYSQYAEGENATSMGNALKNLADAQAGNGQAEEQAPPQNVGAQVQRAVASAQQAAPSTRVAAASAPKAASQARNARNVKAQDQNGAPVQAEASAQNAEEWEYEDDWEGDWEYVWDSDAEALLCALDFSEADGSTIRDGLKQLIPSLYASTARASIDDSRAVAANLFQSLLATDSLRRLRTKGAGMATSEVQSEGVPGLTFFARPYGGWSSQKAWEDNPGYRTSTVGLLAGLNREFGSATDSLNGVAGVHIALGHREVKTRSGVSSKSRAETLRVGAHAVIRPTDAVYVAGLANIGIESIKAWRDVSFEDYSRSSKADYTALIATAALRTGYEWQFDGWRFGPLAGLEYAGHRRPRVTEHGGGASSMWLDSDTLNSLRTQVGVNVQFDGVLNESTRWRASLTGLWAHELLKNESVIQAAFADYREVGFTVRQSRTGRDAMVLQGSVGLDVSESFSLNAFVGAELFRKGQTAGQVGLNAEWRF